ncbi:MAG: DUF2059 domain-containing protein [Polaromonas sp.]|nr:DUF2059 domain-containing protein [Polaromonas sp.]
MKKLFSSLLIAGCVVATSSHAQTADPKLEWATKVVAVQQADLEGLVAQLAGTAAQDLTNAWGPRFQANVPKARQAKATEDFNAELSKFATDANKIILAKVSQANSEALIPAYMERFTLDELKQLAAFFESPVIKKYKAATPELVDVFIKKLVASTQPEIQARASQFDAAAAKIVGAAPAAPAAPAARPQKK